MKHAATKLHALFAEYVEAWKNTTEIPDPDKFGEIDETYCLEKIPALVGKLFPALDETGIKELSGWIFSAIEPDSTVEFIEQTLSSFFKKVGCKYIKVAKITLLYTCPKCKDTVAQALSEIEEAGTAFCAECDEDCVMDDTVRVEA